MKTLCLLLALIILSSVTFAQTEEWLWAKQAGGTSDDNGSAITIDTIGNSYVTGCFGGIATFGMTSLTSNGYLDIIIAKLDSSGNYLWAKHAGGTSDDRGYDIAIDNSGNSYVTGNFWGTATFGTTSLTSNGRTDIFIAKLDSSGNYLWAEHAGGTSDESGVGIVIDSNGNIYVTGSFSGTATFGTYSLTSSGSSDIYIAKLDANGNYLWARQGGGTDWDTGRGLSIDSNGNCFIVGHFSHNAVFGSNILSSVAGSNVFVAKIDMDGNWLWTTQAGVSTFAYGQDISNDYNGNTYVTGCFQDTATFGSSTFTANNPLYFDIFAAKLDSNGNWLWAKQVGVTNGDHGSGTGYGIATDSNGNSYVTGSFSGTATFGTYSLTSSGSSDVLITKLDTNGNYLWAKQAGGTSGDMGYDIAIDNSGNSYVTGNFWGTATFGTTSLTSNGRTDIFIAKIGAPIYYVLAPNGGEIWQFASTKTVYWNISNGNEVNVLLSMDDGVNWILLNSSPVAYSLGRFSFTVPSISSSQCLIKVISTEYSDLYDVSDAPFSIGSNLPASLCLTAPATTNMQTSKNYMINWLATEVATINLDYSLDAGVSWSSLAASLPANLGIYNWMVPDTPAAVCYLKVSDAAIPTNYDWNDEPFTICSLHITSPNGGNSYQTGTANNITWDSAQINSVKLEYSSNCGASWTQIIASTAATTGFYEWTVPTIVSSQYLIRISDVADTLIYDISDNVFTVFPLFPELELSVTGLQFGNVYLSSVSAPQALWLKNNGTAILRVDSLAFRISDTPFEVVGLTLPLDIAVGDSTALQIHFTPVLAIAVTDSLFINNNSINLPRATIRLSGTGEFVPLMPPDNLHLEMDGSNAVISWDAVTETIFHTPIAPDYYLVFFNGTGDIEDDYYYLDWSDSLSYSHQRVGLHSTNMFYQVRAYKFYDRSECDITSLGLLPGMKEDEVLRKLNVGR